MNVFKVSGCPALAGGSTIGAGVVRGFSGERGFRKGRGMLLALLASVALGSTPLAADTSGMAGGTPEVLLPQVVLHPAQGAELGKGEDGVSKSSPCARRIGKIVMRVSCSDGKK